MSAQPYRLSEGGLIDRDRPIGFTFNVRAYQGYHCDTLASALLANGVRLVGRRFKYHRPRGVFGAGAEEPNGLVQLGRGARTEPNLRATQIELFDGLAARSQNCWPSVGFDLGAVAGLAAPLLPSGFYYKTFKWPLSQWMTYERFIRRAAGMGKAPDAPDPDQYDRRYAHCDVLVAGGGPAGLAAAQAAAQTGARVILADENAGFGGALCGDGGQAQIDGGAALDWVAATRDDLAARPEVTLLNRATVFGYYDHNFVAIAERVADHLPAPFPHQPRQRLWLVRARHVVLATGAIERPLLFANNDRPGVMLASAARAYVNAYAVRPGSRAVLFTNNDGAYKTALDLKSAGVEIAAVIDMRTDTTGALPAAARSSGIECLNGFAVTAARGRKQVRGVEVAALNAAGGAAIGKARRIKCDLLCVSGGWTPAVHLFSQSGGRLRYDESQAAFLPDRSKQAERSAGAAKGLQSLADCLADGLAAGAEAAHAAGFGDGAAPPAPTASDDAEAAPRRLWNVPVPGRIGSKRFVDLQNDVTVDDLGLAVREGYRSVEHAKRYTTLGMGTDQGKTSNINGFAVLAGFLGCGVGEVGTTTFRPPYTAVTMGAIAGREAGAYLAALRRTPIHDWHVRAGAVFVPAGLWQRARYYPKPGEGMAEAAVREVRAVRSNVGLVDISTFGKIDLQGPDVTEFLDRIYINGWRKLPIGRARYGVMLREDGLVFDDGTTTRIGENQYAMTTTTAHASEIMAWIEFYLQTVWPELDVRAGSVTEQWAAMALAGPNARQVLATLTDDIEISNAAFPYLDFRAGHVAGVPARVFRISFSGELAYEINVPADYGTGVWEAVLRAGETFGIVPYGAEAMAVLRIEKGFFTHAEADGRVGAESLGIGRMLSETKGFIGRRSLGKPALADPNKLQLVGLTPVDGTTRLSAGAQLVAAAKSKLPVTMQGHVTSVCYSPTLDKPIALAMLKRGEARHGETLYAHSPLRDVIVPVTVTDPVFFDPEGERFRA